MHTRSEILVGATLLFASSIALATELGTRELSEGDSGSDVIELQDDLKTAGFDPGPVDGKFGPKTERAVRSFQASAGLAVDGIVGKKTVAALEAKNPPPAPSQTTADTGNEADGLPMLEQEAMHSKNKLKGVDVSKYDGQVDWAKVKAAGYSFGIARVSDGTSTHDATFARNWAGMKQAGLVRGVYQFFRASQDPVKQADYLLSQVGKFGADDLPPFLDMETKDGESGSVVASRMAQWIAHVKAKTGLTPIVYVTKSFWESIGNPPAEGCLLWVANWGVKAPKIPTRWSDWTFWQYTSTGHVPGIGSNVDLSYFKGSTDDLKKLGRPAGPAAPAQATAPAQQPAAETAIPAQKPAQSLGFARCMPALGD
ncbi:MAG TPA: GH25 family lysozyme [Planctomycetota bacterium]|nr:GH25 family lysozyme [Planctomycetota bacterium]